MCNGTSSRVSQGGTIAVLQKAKPTSSIPTPRPQLIRELSLRLSADANNSGQTKATLSGLDEDIIQDSYFVIHRDGDLASNSLSETSILHRFAVPRVAHDGQAFSLNQVLDLGVGGEGVVGRRVSLIQRQMVLGQGIIGWN